MRERSHERSRGPHSASWKSVAVPVRGACESLDCGVFLHLFAADRAGVLVAVAVLDCGGAWWRPDLPDVASLGRTVFLLCGDADVRLLGSADEDYRSGQ